jgi:hypothetical protein
MDLRDAAKLRCYSSWFAVGALQNDKREFGATTYLPIRRPERFSYRFFLF